MKGVRPQVLELIVHTALLRVPPKTASLKNQRQRYARKKHISEQKDVSYHLPKLVSAGVRSANHIFSHFSHTNDLNYNISKHTFRNIVKMD